mgnify:CR=1 FL=1
MAWTWAQRSEESKRRHVERTRQYLVEHPEVRARINANRSERYKSDLDLRRRAAEARDRFRKNNPIGQAWGGTRGNAKARNLEFNLPRDLFNDLVTDNCFYCHVAPDPVHGLDRVNNNLGYTSNNVVTCCSWCNFSKRARSRAEFESWACRIADSVRMVSHG